MIAPKRTYADRRYPSTLGSTLILLYQPCSALSEPQPTLSTLRIVLHPSYTLSPGYASAIDNHSSNWKPSRTLQSLSFSMDQSSSPPDRRHDVPNRPKRRKIAVACDECRTRKVRCDGVQPGMNDLLNVICFFFFFNRKMSR